MYKKSVLHKNEMNEKTTKFLDKFVKRVKAYPPGVCPIAVQLSFLQSSRSQTCGQVCAVPGRFGASGKHDACHSRRKGGHGYLRQYG